MSPRATVCVCTYNRAAYLRRALASLALSPVSGVRYVVVDNASTDETGAIVREFPLFEHVRNPANLGMVGNWNRALEIAEGEYGAVFHDDDEYEAGAVEALLEALAASKTAAFVHAGVTLVDGAGAPLREPPLLVGGVRSGRAVARELMRSGRSNFFAPTVIFRKDAIGRAGAFDPTYVLAADLDMWMRLCLEGDVAYVPRRLVRYRQHGMSGTWRSNVVVYAREMRRVQSRIAATLENGRGRALARAWIEIGFHWTLVMGMGVAFSGDAPNDPVNAQALRDLAAAGRGAEKLTARLLLFPPIRALLRLAGATARLVKRGLARAEGRASAAS